MTFNADQTAALKAPLDKSNVKEREQGGKKLSYVEAWHAIAEANRIFGFDGWTRETVHLEQTNREMVTLQGKSGPYQQWRVGYIAKVRITAGGVIREGTGFGSGMSKPEALGDAIESAVKEAESDAMKRALMTFGNPFGLALYDKSHANVCEEPPAQTMIDVAINVLRGCSSDKALFKETWERNKPGWQKAMSNQDYARVVGEMKRIADAFPKEEAPPPPKDDLSLALDGDNIPEFA